jgi:hypothetical protein
MQLNQFVLLIDQELRGTEPLRALKPPKERNAFGGFSFAGAGITEATVGTNDTEARCSVSSVHFSAFSGSSGLRQGSAGRLPCGKWRGLWRDPRCDGIRGLRGSRRPPSSTV